MAGAGGLFTTIAPVLCGAICVSLLQNCPKLVDYYIRSNPRLTHPEAQARRVSIRSCCSHFVVGALAPSGAPFVLCDTVVLIGTTAL